jgi:hypothetical protein
VVGLCLDRSPTNWHSHRFGILTEDAAVAADLTSILLGRRPQMIAIEEGGHHLGLKAGFDEEFARFGPSLLMFHDLMARDFSLGLATFDFLERMTNGNGGG